MIPTMDVLKEYLGMIQEYPDVVDIHRGAVRKVRDCERMKEEGRIDVSNSSSMVGNWSTYAFTWTTECNYAWSAIWSSNNWYVGMYQNL